MTSRSEELFERARRVMPGGVSSPVRAFGAVGGTPPFIRKGSGAYIEDVDGRRYIDLVMSWGPLILGHSHPEVAEAVRAQVALGASFGAPSEPELALAETICRLVPSVERVRLVSSGTEAVMSAARLARAATGRRRLLKFAGGYHGHYDPMLEQGGSGLATLGLEARSVETAVAPYNDLAAAEEVLAGGDVAAVFVEPIAANMGVVAPAPGFLEGLRAACDESGTLLVFDEVITGFRVALGGAQERFGIRPDLTVLGKIIGGGLPVGAYGGRDDLMRLVAPEGPVYQAGTLAGNPIACAAGLATLRVLERDPPYARLEAAAERLAEGLHDLPVAVSRSASLLTVFFADQVPVNYEGARRSDLEAFGRLHGAMLADGVYLPPSQFEAWFLSTAHDGEVLDSLERALAANLERIIAAR
ncbi:MAG TPA: glutamate-1-semialdehyde 2,1-aminomutase [Candidatus Dormibacteraeota bacterium]